MVPVLQGGRYCTAVAAPSVRIGGLLINGSILLQALEPAFEELAESAIGNHVRIAKFQAETEREFASDKFGLKTFPTIVLLPKATMQTITYPSERRDVDTLTSWLKSFVSRTK